MTPSRIHSQTHRSFSRRLSYSSVIALNMSDKVRDKKGNPIEEGDSVFSRIRGGRQEGEVSPGIITNMR